MNGTTRFLYGENEVECTGRYVDKRDLISRINVRWLEITPLDAPVRWTKFVPITELFPIQYFESPKSLEKSILPLD
jgi:hypothetical protein